MDDRRVGRIFREIRIRKAWRQKDLSAVSGVSQGVISRIELGRLGSVSLRRLRAVGDALDLRISLDAWWQSGQVDRLIDRGHAALVEHVVATLNTDGWLTRVEVTFNHFGDRGSADIVAWHPGERILLIVEVKTVIGDIQATASSFERKVRVLPDALAHAEDWDAHSVARLLVIADTHANRAVVRDHAAIFDAIWPARTAAVRSWLRKPSNPEGSPRRGFGGIWFLPFDRTGSGIAGIRVAQRVRTPGTVRRPDLVEGRREDATGPREPGS